jgi:hypothetical protein
MGAKLAAVLGATSLDSKVLSDVDLFHTNSGRPIFLLFLELIGASPPVRVSKLELKEMVHITAQKA